jgi:integrase
MAEAGAPPKYVQRQLGHSSFQVTMDVYSHLFPDGNREWVRKLDEPVKTMPLTIRSATQAQPEAIAVGDGIAN